MAGNKELIDEIVSPEAVKQVGDLKKYIDELEVSFVKLAKGATAANNATSNSASGGGFTKTVAESNKATKALVDNAEKTRLAEIKLQQAREKAFDSFERNLDKQAASAAKTSSEYYKLEQAYNAVNKGAKDAAVKFGLTSYQFKEASAQALGLRKRLDEIDQPLGNYGRNVGNYAGKFNGLSNSINQLTREAPAFAVSVQTGFLALSNNLPIFFDEIKRTKDELAALRAEGQKAPSLLSKLAGSFFSVGTALSLGVTLLTLYGGEIVKFVGSLFNGTKAMDTFAERQKTINDVFKDGNRDAASQITNLKYLYEASTNVANSMDKRLDAAIALQKEFPTTFGLQSKENIINGEASTIYTQLTKDIIANARAKAAASKIGEETAKILDAEVQSEKIRNANEKENIRTQKDLDKTRQELSTGRGGGIRGTGLVGRFSNELKQNNARTAAELKTQKDLITTAQNNIKIIEKVFDPTAIGNSIATPGANAAEEAEAAKKRADEAKKRADEAKKRADEAKKRAKELLDIARDSAIELRELQNEYEKQIEDARKRGEKAEMERLKKELKDKEDLLSDSNNKRLLINSQGEDEALNLLTSRYRAGLISAKEYEDGRQIIEQESALLSIDSAIQLSEDLIAVQKSYGENTQSEEDKLAKLRLSRSKLVRDGIIADLKTEAEARKQLKDLTKQVAEEAAQFVITLVNAGFENRKNKLQEQINLTDENAKAEIDAVNRSLISNTDKAAKVQLIEAQADAQKKQLQREQKRTDQEKAKFDKAISLARIVQATAEAEISALSYLSNPITAPLYPGIAALIAALGAIQLATVLATPIPAYEKGTKNAKGGMSLVGEKGTEYVITPQGATFLTPNKPTLMDIPQGSTVIPHLQTARMMEVQKYAGGQAIDISQLVNEQRRTTAAIAKQKGATLSGWLQESKAASANINRRNQYFR